MKYRVQPRVAPSHGHFGVEVIIRCDTADEIRDLATRLSGLTIFGEPFIEELLEEAEIVESLNTKVDRVFGKEE